MPSFGPTAQEEYALSQVAFDDPRKMREFQNNIRNSQRMNLPEEPEPITKLSEDQRVFIYNAGPWRYEQLMGSYGTYTIPGLDETLVMSPELAVAGPLVIDGLPKEYYPTEGLPRPIYHQPRKNMGRETKKPGYDFAMEVIGVGMMVGQSNDLRHQGVFVSEQRQPSRPEKSGGKEAWDAFNRWVADVKTAQVKLREYCAKECQAANVEHSRGRFAEVRNDKLYQCARILKATETEFVWLKDTIENVNKKLCWSCTTVLKGHALKCPQCGELQVTPAEFDAEKKRRAEMTL